MPNEVEKSNKNSKKRRPWSEEEVNALKKGVQTHGVGCWSTLLRDCTIAPTLEGRSNVNLKDKWRSLLRHHGLDSRNCKIDPFDSDGKLQVSIYQASLSFPAVRRIGGTMASPHKKKARGSSAVTTTLENSSTAPYLHMQNIFALTANYFRAQQVLQNEYHCQLAFRRLRAPPIVPMRQPSFCTYPVPPIAAPTQMQEMVPAMGISKNTKFAPPIGGVSWQMPNVNAAGVMHMPYPHVFRMQHAFPPAALAAGAVDIVPAMRAFNSSSLPPPPPASSSTTTTSIRGAKSY